MGGLDLSATMDAIADNLRAVDGIGNVYAWPADGIQAPAAVVGYPTGQIRFDLTYQRGADRMTFPVWIVIGKVSDRTARDRIARYVSAAGALEVKAALDGQLPAGDPATPTVQTCLTTGCEIETYSSAGVDYLSARFDLDVIS